MMRISERTKEFLLLLVFLSTGFFLFDWWLVVVEILFGGVMYLMIISNVQAPIFNRSSNRKIPNSNEGEGNSNAQVPNSNLIRSWKFFVFFAGLFLLLVFTRAYPFWVAEHPLGYDTGIYRYEIWRSLQALPEYLSGVFLGLPLLTNVAGLFGVSVDALLYGSHALAWLLVWGAVFLLVQKKWGEKASLFTLFFLLVSLVQWQVYEMLLLKQVLALALVFFGFFLLERRSYWIFLLMFFVALVQPLDAFLLGGAIALYAIYAIFSLQERSYWLSLVAIGMAGVLLLFFLEPGFWSPAWDLFYQGLFSVHSVEASLREGILIAVENYGYQTAVLFVLGILGLFFTLRRDGFQVLHAYFFLLLAWIILEFFFYQRLLFQLDLLLIVFASYSLALFVQHFSKRSFGSFFLILLLGGLVFPFGLFWSRTDASLPEERVLALERFCESLPSGAKIIATDTFHAPWVRGFCLSQTVTGPGLFANQWSREEWENVWTGDEMDLQKLLSEYEEPVYFYVGDRVPPSFGTGIFEDLGDGWWEWEAPEDFYAP